MQAVGTQLVAPHEHRAGCARLGWARMMMARAATMTRSVFFMDE